MRSHSLAARRGRPVFGGLLDSDHRRYDAHMDRRTSRLACPMWSPPHRDEGLSVAPEPEMA